MSVVEKKEFVIKHVLPDLLSMKNNDHRYGNKENHFNAPWRIRTYYYGNFYLNLECLKFCGADKWSINATVNIKLLKKTEEELLVKNFNFSQISSYQCMKQMTSAELENYLIDGNLTIECHVTITKMTGIKETLCSFDKSAKKFSDVVLIVEDEKFHVSQNYLASHSPYFDSLFSGKFEESNQSEITLKDIDPCDFQNFLEVIHGEPAVDEDIVEGILKLADMYDSKTVIRRCEEFFLKMSKQSLKVKFDAAIKYKMDKLKEKCFGEMKSVADIEGLIPADDKQYDTSVWKELLEKCISVNKS